MSVCLYDVLHRIEKMDIAARGKELQGIVLWRQALALAQRNSAHQVGQFSVKMLKGGKKAPVASIAQQHERPLPESWCKRLFDSRLVFLSTGENVENIPYHIIFLLLVN
jgi:hypothetical protein